jgi:hypothetical protein
MFPSHEGRTGEVCARKPATATGSEPGGPMDAHAPHAVVLPDEEAVHRFFEKRDPCTAAELAALLGLSPQEVASYVSSGEISAEDDLVPWAEAVHAFREAWPPEVADDLARGVGAYPELLRVVGVSWHIPAYILRALEFQADRARGSGRRHLTLAQLVAEELEAAIDPETITELARDPAFRAALHFPEDVDQATERDEEASGDRT